VVGTTGYARNLAVLAMQYESITLDEVHRPVLHLFPRAASTVLDIGAGTGRDAAALTLRGHDVVAVEPTAEMRHYGQRAHPDEPIEWVDDALPELPTVRALGREFELILMAGVWMHLDRHERAVAMCVLAGLLDDAGRIVMTLRHGPPPEGRRMYDVAVAETVGLATAEGLTVIHRGERADLRNRAGVTWSTLVFERGARAPSVSR
jgi:SAM-dependent methyltransferase